jgi:hypothetical protein
MKKFSLTFFLMLAAVSAVAFRPAMAGDDGNTYAKLLGNTFELQIQALEHLVTTETPYQENAARHAMGIVSTADLLTDTIDELELTTATMDKARLKSLNDATWMAANDLSNAVKVWLEGQDKKVVLKAIKNLRVTCDNCHGG